MTYRNITLNIGEIKRVETTWWFKVSLPNFNAYCEGFKERKDAEIAAMTLLDTAIDHKFIKE